MLAVNPGIGEAALEVLDGKEGSVRIHEFPGERIVAVCSGDKPGGTAGAADFIGRVLGDRHTGRGKRGGSEGQDQNEDQSERDEFFHF